VKKLPGFKEHEISLPCSQDPVSVPCELSPSHIRHSIPRSLKLLLSFRLNDRIFYSFPLSATRATCTAQSHQPPFHIANNIMRRVRPMKLSLLTVLLSPTLASLSRSNIYSLWYSERICVFLRLTDQVLHPQKTKQTVITVPCPTRSRAGISYLKQF